MVTGSLPKPFIAKQLINLTKKEIRVAAQTEDGSKQIAVTLEPVGEAAKEEFLKKSKFEEIFTMLIVDQDSLALANELGREETGDLVVASVPDVNATCQVKTEDGIAIETVTVSRLATLKSGRDVALEYSDKAA